MPSTDIRAWTQFREALQQLPQELQRVGAGIVEDEAKAAAFDIRAGYRAALQPPEETGQLVAGVEVEQLGPLHWKVWSTDYKAHWWEFGTAVRRAKKRGDANRGRMAARPTLIPVAIKRRSRMVGRLVGLLEQAGFRVTGYG